MSVYAYKAFTKDGKKTKGSIDALTEKDAKEKLRAMDLLLFELKLQGDVKKKEQLQGDSLLVFTSQLSQLTTSKIPLYESLLALEEQSRQEAYHPVILGLAERIKSGSSLSKALSEYPSSFSPLYQAIIAAGEAVGSIDRSLHRLQTLLSYQMRIVKQLISALTYPIFLMILMFASVFILVGFVIPSIEVLFEDRKVPAFTQFVFSLSKILRGAWLEIFIVIGCSIVASVYYLRKKEVKLKLQRLCIRIPIIKRFFIHASLARFAKTLATLLDGGLPLVNALSFAKEALRNARLEEIVRHVEDRIIEGNSMSASFSRFQEIPALFTRMIGIGEESGQLAPLLSQVATIYEEETERILNRFVTLVQPILLLLMGAIVGTVLLSILLPLSDFGATLNTSSL